ncbi:glycosyltransferase [Echinicola soli]|uniref:Glycosyltransferase n=1 Tax=Echinicola soli TaxID=2591634 RepID=A0A514CN98_9BACT|nr:glycosyltransferase family 4 protein [Echinicola soli]QDH81289.1 glycosyltransferase [Echinicola soli]
MKIGYISTYPPRECGIGTFTQNLQLAIKKAFEDSDIKYEGSVIALSDDNDHYIYPKEVKMTLQQDQQADYLEAADFINLSGLDLCVLEHEFGIFGGESGVYILPLLHKLEMPFIVTLHTVLDTPSYNQKIILKEVCRMAKEIVVMSNKAVTLLEEIYLVPIEKIKLIAHGVPDIQYDSAVVRKTFRFDGKKVLLTFGFISRNKGIETVIRSLPEVIKKYPNTIYLILGKTHPNIIKHAGEEYRNFLHRLARNLDVQDHVMFINEFIDEDELIRYLTACDIYITPYLGQTQITSGTLSYAFGAGCAVASTPYWHAEELLADGKGKIFGFKNHEELSKVLNGLFDHPDELKAMKEKAGDYGKTIIWPEIGRKYKGLFNSVIEEQPIKADKIKNILNIPLMPKFSLAHIKRLTDDTGIIQHAKYGIPNLKEGYCLDDNSRALFMVLMAYKQKRDPLALEYMPIYLSYIHYMQNPDGTFKNFLGFNRMFLDEVGSEDSFGRTILALGYLLGNAPNDAYFQTGRLLFFDAVPNFQNLRSIRSIANTIIGISYYLKTNMLDEQMVEMLRVLTNKLTLQYKRQSTPDWKWFESLLTYDNGILPLALMHAAEILEDDEVLEIAMETMEFLTEHTMKDGFLSIIGNKEWYEKDGHRSVYAQQPIDALAMVQMYYQAFLLTRENEYLEKLFTSFMWFLGENDLRMSLYDFETKGCCDGFESYGVNRNQGAESSLAYLVSHLVVLQAHEEFYKSEQPEVPKKKTDWLNKELHL